MLLYFQYIVLNEQVFKIMTNNIYFTKHSLLWSYYDISFA